MRVGILGASGFIGKHLSAALQQRGDEVVTASLREPKAAAQTAASCQVVVNLAGEPVAQRWTPEAKRKIEESRTVAVAAWMDELAAQPERPDRFISASAIGYYGTSETATFTEDSPAGSDFLAHVCEGWERNAKHATTLGMGVACIRTGLALGSDGGALEKILPPFRMGAGGRIGNGKQWVSWVHVDDVVNIYLMAIDGVDGVLNATAPNPVRNSDFTKSLGRALHRPTLFPVPGPMIAAMLGEGAYLLTEGQRVVPERTTAAGYTFQFPALEPALATVL